MQRGHQEDSRLTTTLTSVTAKPIMLSVIAPTSHSVCFRHCQWEMRARGRNGGKRSQEGRPGRSAAMASSKSGPDNDRCGAPSPTP